MGTMVPLIRVRVRLLRSARVHGVSWHFVPPLLPTDDALIQGRGCIPTDIQEHTRCWELAAVLALCRGDARADRTIHDGAPDRLVSAPRHGSSGSSPCNIRPQAPGTYNLGLHFV